MYAFKNIKQHKHGVVSLLLFLGAMGVALVNMFRQSVLLGLGYLVVGSAAVLTLSYFYCLKCPCRLHNCSHVFLGKLTKIFSKDRNLPYSGIDYIMVILSLVLLFGIPLFWLFSNFLMLGIYLGCAIIASVEIYFFVCVTCENTACALNRKIIFKR